MLVLLITNSKDWCSLAFRPVDHITPSRVPCCLASIIWGRKNERRKERGKDKKERWEGRRERIQKKTTRTENEIKLKHYCFRWVDYTVWLRAQGKIFSAFAIVPDVFEHRILIGDARPFATNLSSAYKLKNLEKERLRMVNITP